MDQLTHSPNLAFVPPMLMRRVPQLPEGPGWSYEVKWAGYRMQLLKENGKVRLLSRDGADYTRRFTEVAKAVAQLRPRTLHLDGEVVAMDQSGRPSFQLLHGGKLPEGWRIRFYAFDLLQQGRRCLQKTSLAERRACLEELLAGSEIKFSPALPGTADQVVKAVREHGLEGVVAKRSTSHYEPGKRSGAWVKFPCRQSGNFVIGGYRPAGDSFSMLLVGRFDGSRFRFAGKVAHGFTQVARKQVLADLRATRRCPFTDLPNVKRDPFNENVTPEEMDSFVWLRPDVEIEVAFAEWTRFGTLRHGEFRPG